MSDFADKVSDWLLQSAAKPLDAPAVAIPAPQADPKAKKSLPKKIIALIVSVTVGFFVLVGVVTTVCLVLLPKHTMHVFHGFSNVHGFVALTEVPEDVDDVIEVDESMSEVEQAAYLYRLASTNAKNYPTVVACNSGAMTLEMFGQFNYIDLDTVIMKDKTTYFKMDYHLINDAPLASLSEGSTSAERWYYEAGMDMMNAQKVYTSVRDEDNVPYATWPEGTAIYTKDVPIFTANQFGIFTVTNHTIALETIKSATVSHNDKEGYWEVHVELDLKNPDSTAYSLADIRSGTGDKKAKYTQVSFNFTVWDCGYMRSVSSIEDWSAKVIVALSFHMETNYYFSYYEGDCDMENYKDLVEAKEQMAPSAE